MDRWQDWGMARTDILHRPWEVYGGEAWVIGTVWGQRSVPLPTLDLMPQP